MAVSTVVVNGVDIPAEFQGQGHGFERLELGTGLFAGERCCRRRRPPSSGVQCSAFGIEGSAPSERRVRMSGTSAVLAASRNGVAPTLPRTPRPDAPCLSRRFTSAPCSTRILTNSKLPRVPDPWGEGLHHRRPHGSACETQVSVWSAE